MFPGCLTSKGGRKETREMRKPPEEGKTSTTQPGSPK